MKKILITGVSSGIGKAIATHLLAQGHTIIGVSRQPERAGFNTPQFIPYSIDLAETHALEAVVKSLAQTHPVLDAMIFNAGMGYFGELEQLSFMQLQTMMQVNFLSQAYMTKVWLPAFKKQTSGHLIFIGSESALQGERKGTGYCASKFALRGFVQSLRQECAKAAVVVTLINPGLVETPFFDDLNFQPGKGAYHSLSSAPIVAAVDMVLTAEPAANFEEITVRPLQSTVIKK